MIIKLTKTNKRRNFMTEIRQKLAELPQEEREQLIKEAQEAGLNSTQIANWYVDTLKAKIAAKKEKNNTAADAAATKTEDQKDNAAALAADKKSDDAADKTSAPESEADIDPTAEAEELDKDVESKAPAKQKAEPDRIAICHICRGKVINGKCTECGFEISRK